MSDNLFEEKKSNKTNEKENYIVLKMNVHEKVNTNSINNQENQNSIFNNSKIKNINNELKDKISEIGNQVIKREDCLEKIKILKEAHYLEIAIIIQKD